MEDPEARDEQSQKHEIYEIALLGPIVLPPPPQSCTDAQQERVNKCTLQV